MPKYRCPYCGSERKPRASFAGSLSGLGKALILLGLLIVCCPLVIFAPLFMGENVEYCPDCGRKIA